MKLRLFLVVFTISLVLLPIYFFNLPMELAPHSSRQVINYFYDRRTYIGIHSVVASSNDNSKGIHRNLKGEEDLYGDDDGEQNKVRLHSPVSSVGNSLSPTSPVSSVGNSLSPTSPVSSVGNSLSPTSPSSVGNSLSPTSPVSSVGNSLSPTSPSSVGNSLSPTSPSSVGNSLSPTSPSSVGNSRSPTSPSSVGNSRSPTSPSQKPYPLTNGQKKSTAQKKPEQAATHPLQKAAAQRVQLPSRLTAIPRYLMSQGNSRLSALGLNSNRQKVSQEQVKRSHGAAWKAMQKLAKRSRKVSRKEQVKMLVRMRLRQRLQMQQLPITVNCTDDACKQLKEIRERYYYEACSKEARKDYEVKPCQCSLLDGKKRGRYALLSLPGSGNTWVRGLLEKATGVCTGSMWCDPSLRAKHFCMEGVRSTSVLVVKNHDTHLRWVGVPLGDGESVNNKPDFIGGILIHRNPFKATIAEWNRDAAVILTANVTDETDAPTQATPAPPQPDNQATSNEAVFTDAIKSETRKAVHRLHHVTSDSLNASKNHHLAYFGKEMFGKCFFTLLRSTFVFIIELRDKNVSLPF